MRWALSQDQSDFQEEFRGWLDHSAPSQRVRAWLGSEDTPFEELLANDGWLAAGLPEEIGGSGGGLVDAALAAEAMGGHAVPSGGWLASLIALPALTAAGIAEDLLQSGAYAALVTPADRAPDLPSRIAAAADGALSGRVELVLGATHAQQLIVPARDDSGTEGLYLLTAAAPGVRRTPSPLLDASRDTAAVELTGATGTPIGGNTGALREHLALRAAVLIAADSLGAMQRMLDLAVTYSGQREQFGVPIGSFQAVKHAAATILVAVEAARSIVYAAAAAIDQGHELAAHYAAAAKAQVTADAAKAADSALTMHGAIGYTWEHDLQLYYKRAKLNAVLHGSPAAWNDRLAGLAGLAG